MSLIIFSAGDTGIVVRFLLTNNYFYTEHPHLCINHKDLKYL